MYDRDRIAERLDSATEQLGWRPEYHTVEEVDQVKRALDRIANFNDTGQFVDMKRPFTEREQRWIRNERMLCACDAAYFCNTPEAPIWMADYTFKELGEIKLGDKVMGWERVSKKNDKTREQYRSSEVLAIGRRTAMIFKVTMESGAVLRCTEDHLWSSGSHHRGREPWITAKPGRHLRRILTPYANTPPDERKAGWLGGIYDGEGSRCKIAQSQSYNPVVHSKIYELLQEFDFDPGIDKNGVTIAQNYGNLAKFLLWCKPIRGWSMLKHMNLHPHMRAKRDKILSVVPDGFGEVVSMQTSTGNYIAWGYASKNCTRYAYIKDEKNNIKRFSFRGPQRVYFEILAQLERRGAAIQLQILKARQLGMSTITELLVAHRIFFTYGVNAVIASSAQQQTQIMSQMIFLVYDNLPYWMQPPPTRRVESDKGMLVLGGIQSGVSFQHGSQTSGIARGTTPTVIHLSEVASFPNAEDLIEASLYRAVHESENVFMILESTAEGVDNWWHRTWKSSKSGWPKGKSRLCPLFLPWYLGTDIYPTPTWIQTRPIPHDWVPSRETKGIMAKAKMYVNNDPLLAAVLGENWEMGAPQAWYWEVNYEEYKLKGREKLWFQEMPGDDIECFQSSFDSVFGNDLLAELHDARTKEYSIYAIEGQGIEDKFRPYDEDLDWDKPRRIVQYKNARGESYTWTLIPLLDSCIEVPDDPMDPDMENALEQADGKLLIFHEPRAGMDYTIGVDSGQGVGGDSTVISVWAKGKGGVPDIQCAEFSSNLVSHIEAYPFVMAIASLYMKHMDHPREPLVSIEVLAAVGDMVQLQMGKMGYSRFHQFVRYDSKKISKRKAVKRGWFTTSWSRPLLVDGFTHSVKNGWVEIHSPFLLAEMKNFEVHMTGGGKEKLEHADGSHDDRVFAGAIAVFTSHDLDAMVERGKKRYIPASQNYRPEVDIGIYNAGNFIGDQQFAAQIKTSTDLENLMSDRFSY